MTIDAETRTARYAIRKIRDGDDTLDLRYALYPSEGPFDRYLVFLNGRTEWIEKYDYLPDDLGLPRSVGFLTWDHRGQGDSGGARAMVRDYEVYAEDARRIVETTTGGRPYVIVAHSMGGLIALVATLTGRLSPKALVLCSPLLGLPHEPIAPPIARPLARLLTKAGLGAVSSGAGSHTRVPFERNRLTHDPARYRRMCATPYPVPGATFGWVDATFRATDLVFERDRLASLTAPTLVISGGNETVVDQDAFRRWVELAADNAKAKIGYRKIPGARHELLSEIDTYYRPTLSLIRDWLADFLS